MLLTRRIREVEVNFISEVMHMDKLQILVPVQSKNDNVYDGFIRIKEDNRQAFAARITFE